MSTQEIKVSMQGETNYTLKAVQIKDLKQGDFFTLKPVIYPTEKQVYERGAFERSGKKYSCTRYDDICAERFFKGDKIVYTEFIF